MCDCNDECQAAPGVSRREFLAGSSAAVVGALLAGCGDGVLGGGPGGTSTGGSFQMTVAKFPALAAVGGIALVSGASVPLVVVRTGAATFDVFNRRCPHNGTQINPLGGGFRCPNHGAIFTLAGKNSGGFRTSDLRKIAARFDATTGILSVEA